MPIRPSIDAATRVSVGLSELIENLVNDPDRETPASLGDVRELLRERTAGNEMEYLDPEDRESLLVELDGLIEEFGEEAALADFIEARASEALSRLIEGAMNDPALPEEPTLGAVREAMLHGLGSGMAEDDETIEQADDSGLFDEIDELIRRYGEDAPAENFIRFD
jgi:hypothetical protein